MKVHIFLGVLVGVLAGICSEAQATGVNITFGNVPNSQFESETAAVPLDSPPGSTFGHAVAYNSPDLTRFPGKRLTCAGMSLSAFSYDLNPGGITLLTGTVHQGIRFPTPKGISELAGDPGIAVIDSGSSWTVYVSSLAISNGVWNEAGPDSNDCLSGVPNPDFICVSVASVPKNGNLASLLPNQGWCAGNSSNYDGTTMTTDGSNVYVASWSNTFFGQVHVFKNGVQLASPFQSQPMGAHPLFVKSQFGIPTLIAPDVDGNFWVSTYGNQWSAQSEIPSPGWFARDDPEVPLAGETIPFREIGFDAVSYGVPYLSNTLWLFYSKKQPSGLVSVQGVECTYVEYLPTISCSVPANAITPSGHNAYLPAAAVNFLSNAVWLSYWTDSSPTGILQMEAAKVTTAGFTNYALTGVTERPCVEPLSEPGGFMDGYWGDYDTMIIANYNSPFPGLLRYFTDSTDGGTCNTSTGLPQHVSVTFGDAAL